MVEAILFVGGLVATCAGLVLVMAGRVAHTGPAVDPVGFAVLLLGLIALMIILPLSMVRGLAAWQKSLADSANDRDR